MGKINVTKSFLPPLEEYEEYLQQIWKNGQLTNQGPLLCELQEKLEAYLGVANLHFVTNGTLALQVALRALGITEGEVITTPFSYVATTSSILWERCKPVFVDIEPDTFCIDANKIEAAITPATTAIMAVHVFGFPCNVEKIEAVAVNHNLKVIYDAAHAFGVEYRGKSLLAYGDIATCSFHATKLFHTVEGGAVIAKDPAVSEKVELVKKFGHRGDDHVMLGINAKASELQAAMGLCNLKYIDDIIRKRKAIFELYNSRLAGILKTPIIKDGTKHNYAYYPVTFKTEEELLNTVQVLKTENVFPRRYFYPSLNLLPYVDMGPVCPVSEAVAKTILCLPLYSDLDLADAERITKIIVNCNAA